MFSSCCCCIFFKSSSTRADLRARSRVNASAELTRGQHLNPSSPSRFDCFQSPYWFTGMKGSRLVDKPTLQHKAAAGATRR